MPRPEWDIKAKTKWGGSVRFTVVADTKEGAITRAEREIDKMGVGVDGKIGAEKVVG